MASLARSEHHLLIPNLQSWEGQFLISGRSPRRSGWDTKYQLRGFGVYLYPETRSVEVRNSEGDVVGCFIGTLIDPESSEVVRGPLTLSLPSEPADAERVVENFAYPFAGSWLLVVVVRGSVRIHLDSDGTKPLVYEPNLGAASSVGLLLDDEQYVERFDSQMYSSLDIEGEGWFPAGLTAHRGVRRLLCNHYLDLPSFAVRRHWPSEELRLDITIDETAERVASHAAGVAVGLLKEGETVAALTGGNETRFLLAAFRQIASDLNFVTVASAATRRDVELAGRLAAVASLGHSTLPFRQASESQQADWRYRASHCVTGSNMVGHPSIQPLARYAGFLGGLGGEVGRAFLWRSSDDERTPLSASSLVSRLGLPLVEEVVSEVDEWLSGLEGLDTLEKLDLAYLELRMSAWAFAAEYSSRRVPHFHPMIGRESYRLMLGQAPESKRENALIRRGIQLLWPELLDVPINRFGDYRDATHALSRLAKPKLVVKKLRKVLG